MIFIPLLADLSVEQKDLVLDIYEKYADFMYSEAYGILHNKHDAEDAVSDTMVKIIKYIEKFSENDGNKIRNKVVISIRSAIRNKAIDYYKSNKKKSGKEVDMIFTPDDDDEFEVEVEDKGVNIEELMITKETQEIVQKALLQLTEEQQYAINLVYFSGFSQEEAAEYLGIKAGTLRKRIFTARNKLRELLGGEFGERNEK